MIDRLDNWINNSYKVSLSELGMFRIIYGLYIVLITGFTKYSAVFVDYPRSTYDPAPGIGSLFSEIPPLIFFQISEVIVFVSAICILIGFLTRWSSIAFTIFIVILDSIYFGSGKIDHSFVVWLIPLVLSFSNWGMRFSIDEYLFKSRNVVPRSWPITYMSLFVGFGFFTAGMIKLAGGWLSWNQSMVQGYVIRNAQLYDRAAWLCEPVLKITNVYFWEALDWMTILFEIGFLFAVLSSVIFRFFTLNAIFFHVGIFLLMKITFSNYLILYLLFWLPMFSFEKYNIDIFKKKILIFLVSISILAILFRLLVGYQGLGAWIFTEIFGQGIAINQVLVLLAGILVLILIFTNSRYIFSRSYDEYKAHLYGIISFDGYCNFCNKTLLWIIKNDKNARYRFTTLSDEDVSNDRAAIEYLDTGNNYTFRQSRAFLEICRKLDGRLPFLYLLVIVPGFIRDFVYNYIARNRYKWFGKKEQCMIPTADIKSRFTDSIK